MSKLSVSELLRLACVCAERDQEAFIDAMDSCRGNPVDDKTIADAEQFVKQVRAYRLKRWGKSKAEATFDNATPTPIEQIAGRENTKFGQSA